MSAETTTDQRSIGELLWDADFRARELLLDVVGDDAPAMLRTWGEVVQTAAELWSKLPAVLSPNPAEAATMQRLEAMGRAQHRSQLRSGWPGDGPPDERLLKIADAFHRAGRLAAGPGRRIVPDREDVLDDLHAARMRVMHTLYVSAHAVGVAVHQHVEDCRVNAGRHASARDLRAIPRGRDAATRIGALEQLAGEYVGRRFSRAVDGEHYTPPAGMGRLNLALTRWDTQVHRTLAATPRAPNLHLVTATQGMIATASTAILAAAASAGQVDDDAYEHRIATALDVNQQMWVRAANRWGALSSRGERADPALVQSANELRAALHEIAFDRTRWAAPQVVAGRVDLGAAAATVRQSMIAGAEVACIYRDITDERDLVGSARTIAAWIRPDDGAPGGHADLPVDDEAALVPPREMHGNRAVAIPAVVRRTLIAEATRLVDASEAAMSASGALAQVLRQPLNESQECSRCGPGQKDRRAILAEHGRPANPPR
ncbi:hypothetical protein [Allobranchiibius sp. CTAmp26]|uniref:hypothetical protein n=1 Tax=Allobranchiibius sp. CTAmp26 TaxID=2815214 RepID=UPI001AA156A8|nr:hypothetical protein [Allobranchiibius sp. CTAmp26]MBO1756541.1 hypothetical protein [Allobranchiibius sp. CTAmp26]